jgi:Fe-S-cluster-containing dehydrogenase component/DMSO reductase anchor subunit
MKNGPTDEPRTLIDELLAEQQQLTAVDRFARRHADDAIPAQAKYYRDLIPLNLPQPGQQYAFEVDLDRCTGCKACVSACHSLNGLDDGETWRDVGLLFSDDWRQPFQQTVTTACHHCADPGCLSGCPVLAYDKDPVTGVVRHLDDQCIGCQYCVMKCPYDVPKYSAKRGIVRKCDMCANRLAVGEAPACAQACPSEAIRITIVDRAAIAAAAQRGEFLSGAPDPRLTLPTTRYKSKRPIPANLLGGDHASVTPSCPHLPLVFMLVFTQLSAGASVAALFAGPAKRLALAAAVSGALALAVATLHLGRPLQAWRAFLGWRRSWFSREVIMFGCYVPVAAAVAAAICLGGAPHRMMSDASWQMLVLALKISAALLGLTGVACSAMIYVDTGRQFWRASQCFGKFFGTTFILGAAATLVIVAFQPPGASARFAGLVGLVFATMVAKLGFEQRIYRDLVDENTPTLNSMNKTARLLAGRLGFAARSRVAFGVLGGCLLPLLLMFGRASGQTPGPYPALFALCFCIVGELLERYCFFAAVAPAKMPGGAAA